MHGHGRVGDGMRNQRGFSTTLIAGAVALLVIGGLLVVQTKRVETCKTEYAAFVSEVKRLGEEAERKKKETEAADLKSKEKTDAELKTLRADNLSLDERLRDARARGRAVSKPAPRAPSPDRACFKGPLLDAAIARLIDETSRANTELDGEISEIAGRGQDAVSGLNTAKVWASDTLRLPTP